MYTYIHMQRISTTLPAVLIRTVHVAIFALKPYAPNCGRDSALHLQPSFRSRHPVGAMPLASNCVALLCIDTIRIRCGLALGERAKSLLCRLLQCLATMACLLLRGSDGVAPMRLGIAYASTGGATLLFFRQPMGLRLLRDAAVHLSYLPLPGLFLRGTLPGGRGELGAENGAEQAIGSASHRRDAQPNYGSQTKKPSRR